MDLTRAIIKDLGESGIYKALENERKSVFSTYSYAISEEAVNEMASDLIKEKIEYFKDDIKNFNEHFKRKLEDRIKAKIKIH